jgi:chromosome segregation ATPase
MTVDEQLKSLNQKLQQLLKRYQQLQKENLAIKQEMDNQRLLLKEKNELVQHLQEKIDVLKLSSASTIDGEEKKLLERRINGYLAEIEKCLVLLNS